MMLPCNMRGTSNPYNLGKQRCGLSLEMLSSHGVPMWSKGARFQSPVDFEHLHKVGLLSDSEVWGVTGNSWDMPSLGAAYAFLLGCTVKMWKQQIPIPIQLSSRLIYGTVAGHGWEKNAEHSGFSWVVYEHAEKEDTLRLKRQRRQDDGDADVALPIADVADDSKARQQMRKDHDPS